MTGLCFAAGVVCLLYYLVIVMYAGLTADFAWFWLAAALALFAAGGLLRWSKAHPGTFPVIGVRLLLVFLAAGLLFFGYLCGQVIRGMFSRGGDGLTYVVVLGAQVKGDRPSRALKKRLDAALEYAENNEDTILILSGGQGPGEDITEARCMEIFLRERGIPAGRLVLEEGSTSTRENLKLSDELTGCAGERTGILSNNFHVYRAVRLAEKLGYTQAEGIAALSDPIMQVHYVVREVFALVKEMAVGNI